MSGALYAIVALLPAAIGPLPEDARVIQAKLCGGQTIELDIPMQPQAPAPCHAKGCHAGSQCRKRLDPAQ